MTHVKKIKHFCLVCPAKKAPVSRQDQEAYKYQEFLMHENVNVQGCLTSKGALPTELTIPQAQGQKLQGMTTMFSPPSKLLIEIEAILGHMTEDQSCSAQQARSTARVC